MCAWLDIGLLVGGGVFVFPVVFEVFLKNIFTICNWKTSAPSAAAWSGVNPLQIESTTEFAKTSWGFS